MHPLAGRKQSKKHIEKRAKALRGKKLTRAHKKRLSEVRRELGWRAGRPANTPEVIWSKVDKRGSEECWPWMGWRTKVGYGRLEMDGVAYYAHRVILNMTVPGIIDLKAPLDRKAFGFVRHTCDHPWCCNPKHLTIGTNKDNVDDKVERGRQVHYVSIESPRAKLTAEEVLDIRRMKKYGATVRALALLYEVSMATISGCLYGRHYQDVA